MPTAAPSKSPERTTDGNDDALWHVACGCQRPKPPGEQVALCGKRLRGISPTAPVDPSERCNVCDDIRESPAPRPCCGFVRRNR